MDIFMFWAAFLMLIKIVKTICLPSEVYIQDNQEQKCLPTCPQSLYMFRQTCIKDCPKYANVNETALGKFCIVEHDFDCQRISCLTDFPLCYRMNCLEKCPEYTVKFENSCVLECPMSNPFLVSSNCEGPCFTGNATCVERCPDDHPFIFQNPRSIHCLKYCPNYTFEDTKNKVCHLKCPAEKQLLFNKTCHNNCPVSHPFIQTLTSYYNTISLCSESCPQRTLIDEGYCVIACPDGKYEFNNTCIDDCPESHPLKYPNVLEKSTFGRAKYTCVDSCNIKINSYISNNLEYKNHCVSSCPSESNFAFNGSCVGSCPSSQRYNINDKHSEYQHCVEKCPDNTVLTNKTNCRHFCPPVENFMFNRTCHQECPIEAMFYPLYKDSPHAECYKKCPDGDKIFNDTQCASRCPEKAKYENNGTCVTECQGHFGFKLHRVDYYFNSIEKYVCVAKCPVDYLINGNECIKECPSGRKYVFDKTCIETCPIKYNYKQLEGGHYKCIDKCPTNYLINGNECIKECPSEREFVFNNTCNETCPIELNYKQLEGGHYKCIEKCPSTAFVHNELYCVSSCPADALYQVNKTCVATCPSEVRFRYSNFTTITVNWYSKKNVYHHYCLADCPTKTLYNQDACVEECPKEANYLFNRSCDIGCPATVRYRILTGNHFTCLDECPSNAYKYNALCVLTCPVDKNYEHNGTCYQECPEREDFIYRDGSYSRCMNECNPFFTFNKTCLEHCPDEAKFRDNGKCVAYCNDEKRMYTFRNFTVGTGGKKIYDYYCLHTCPVNTFISSLTCVSQCPSDTLQLDNKCVKLCPKERPLNYTTNKGKYLCVHSCPYRTFRFQSVCFDQCPSWLKSHQGTCTHECPKSHPYTDIRSQKCLSACEDNFVITDNNICDKKCPTGKHYIEKNSCVFSCKNPRSLLQTTEQGLVCHDQCPHNLLLMENKGACVKKCPEDKLIVGSVCRALYKCPNHAYLELTDFGKRCTNKCSSGFYLDGKHCVKECPPEKVIYDAVCANECPTTHPLRYKEFGSSNPRLICYRQCPGNYVLISKKAPTQNNKNEKYVIRYSKEDNEEADIIEVNHQNTDHDGDEIVELNDGIETATTFRRRKGKS
ncbi:proprotein convertase subtilisin/kexin type 5-like [Crassostrea angulata]|uniref:proprotein convertase subtilisin/kexin type 5-like n=1 Tax=Magallana angulata TaxID=2784310 RepID=UPI0022B0B4D0|nr:proprotein convertase subtilisin/kexin type 5-like [Crassostrea angulata]